jgi:SulP family sulfate permease
MECILVQSSGINEIDASGIEMLRNLLERFQKSGIKLAFSGLKKQVSDVMDRTGLTDKIGEQNIFATDKGAIDEIRLRLNKQESAIGGHGDRLLSNLS